MAEDSTTPNNGAPTVVIVDNDGTRHVFPPGFNPLQAATIVSHANMYKANQKAADAPPPADDSMLAPNPQGDQLVENLKAGVRNAPAFAGGVAKGVALAVPRTVAGIYQTVRHPIDTANSLATTVMHPAATIDKMNTELSDPANAGDFVGGMIAPSVLPKVASLVGSGLEATGVSQYARGLKPGIAEGRNLTKGQAGYMSPATKAEDLAKFGIANKLQTPAQADSLIAAKTAAIDSHPSMAASFVGNNPAAATMVPAATASADTFVTKSLDAARAAAKRTVTPEPALNTLDRVYQDFVTAHPGALTRETALDIARATSKEIQTAYEASNVPASEVAAKQAIVDGLRDFVKSNNPEVTKMMGEQSRAIKIKGLLEKRELQTANKAPVGMYDLVGGVLGAPLGLAGVAGGMAAGEGLRTVVNHPIGVGMGLNSASKAANAIGSLANNPTLKALQRAMLLEELRKRSTSTPQ